MGGHPLPTANLGGQAGTAYKRSSSSARGGECHCEEDFKSDAAIHHSLMDRHAGYNLLAMTMMFLYGSPDRAALVRG